MVLSHRQTYALMEQKGEFISKSYTHGQVSFEQELQCCLAGGESAGAGTK